MKRARESRDRLRSRERRGQLEERKRRLGRAYVDGHYSDDEYRRQMKAIDDEMDSLVVPEASAAEEAGYLIEQLPELWREATLEQRRRLLLTMLEAVYVDAKDERRIVAIRPKPPFMPVFLTASTTEESWMELTHEPPGVARRLMSTRVPGGDGGESNPPSRRYPDGICYRLIRRLFLAVSLPRRRGSDSASR